MAISDIYCSFFLFSSFDDDMFLRKGGVLAPTSVPNMVSLAIALLVPDDFFLSEMGLLRVFFSKMTCYTCFISSMTLEIVQEIMVDIIYMSMNKHSSWHEMIGGQDRFL